MWLITSILKKFKTHYSFELFWKKKVTFLLWFYLLPQVIWLAKLEISSEIFFSFLFASDTLRVLAHSWVRLIPFFHINKRTDLQHARGGWEPEACLTAWSWRSQTTGRAWPHSWPPSTTLSSCLIGGPPWHLEHLIIFQRKCCLVYPPKCPLSGFWGVLESQVSGLGNRKWETQRDAVPGIPEAAGSI